MQKITSLQHPLVKHLVKLRTNHDYRIEHNAIIIEGEKMIKEASEIVSFKTIVASHPELIPEGIKAKEVFVVTEELIQKISGLQSSDGILAEVDMPASKDLKELNRVLVLDRINDPGNLGTILRTALAFGWNGIFLLQDTCDPFNDKALRAARGAVFKLAIHKGSIKDLKTFIKENEFHCIVADTTGKDCKETNQEKKLALILGNEASGPSDEAKKLGLAVTIPMQGNMESLNVAVAAGILMHALK